MQSYLEKHLVSYQNYFAQKQILLKPNGNIQTEINLNFDHLLDKYLQHLDQENIKQKILETEASAENEQNTTKNVLQDNNQQNDGNLQTDINNLTLDNAQDLNNITQATLQQQNFNLNINSRQVLQQGQFRLLDKDLDQFIELFKNYGTYQGSLLLSGHNLSDQFTIKLKEILISNDRGPQIVKLDLSNNSRMRELTGQYLGDSLKENIHLKELVLFNNQLGTVGLNRIIESLFINKSLNIIDFGKVTNQSFKFLNELLSFESNNLTNIGLQEDLSDPWHQETKNQFLNLIRYEAQNKKILSINIQYDNPQLHFEFLTEISQICNRNRTLMIEQINQQIQQQDFDTTQPDYFISEDHGQNKLKFSCKTYVNNVFHLILDKALYNLEKERMNQLRDEKVQVTIGQPKSVKLRENVFVCEGSLVNLAKYLYDQLEYQKTL